MNRRGPKQKIDISAMAVLALLLVRTYSTRPKPAARAAIKAFFTWVDDPHPDRRVDIHEGAVKKALQRLESGETNIHPDIVKIMGVYSKSTGERFIGTPQELAQSVAEFLPRECVHLLGQLCPPASATLAVRCLHESRRQAATQRRSHPA